MASDTVTVTMAKEPRLLTGRVVAITGGGRGIGRATAQALVREGAHVAIGDIDVEAAARTAADLGGGALGLPLDVTDHAGFTQFLDEVEQRLGPLDVLVNNAGIMPIASLLEESPDSISRQLEINLHAVIHGTQEAIRRMVPRQTGHIVNIASLAGRLGVPYMATYCATKHGVVGFSEAVRLELRGSGVEVSAVMPYFARTELAAGMVNARGQRFVTPEEVADATVSALKHPRFDVVVPRSAGWLVKFGAALPRSLSEAFRRVLKTDGVAVNANRAARAAYERRAAASAPSAEQEREAA
jgi:NAD(P)-dependent dehydrogenase (short-subunit alcohol dehydrogenase family)